jgi:hypothetical protein
MHYANGREVKPGDLVVGYSAGTGPVAGVVVGGFPEADTCNVYIATYWIVHADSYAAVGCSGVFGGKPVRLDAIIHLFKSTELLHAEDAWRHFIAALGAAKE